MLTKGLLLREQLVSDVLYVVTPAEQIHAGQQDGSVTEEPGGGDGRGVGPQEGRAVWRTRTILGKT